MEMGCLCEVLTDHSFLVLEKFLCYSEGSTIIQKFYNGQNKEDFGLFGFLSKKYSNYKENVARSG